jgi:hypothetical protein
MLNGARLRRKRAKIRNRESGFEYRKLFSHPQVELSLGLPTDKAFNRQFAGNHLGDSSLGLQIASPAALEQTQYLQSEGNCRDVRLRPTRKKLDIR